VIQVLDTVKSAVAAAVAKQSKKLAAVGAEAAAAKDSRARTELEGAVKNEEHKLKKVTEVQQQLDRLLAAGGAPSVDALLALAGDQVAEVLDAQQGAEVTDQSIYRAHAAKYEVCRIEEGVVVQHRSAHAAAARGGACGGAGAGGRAAAQPPGGPPCPARSALDFMHPSSP
jgi:hypothetical protein